MSQPPTGMTRVLIVGAGQAGLAMADALVRRKVDRTEILMVDAADVDESAWHRRWAGLRAFTPAWFSTLPGLAMWGDQERYPRTDEIADYLTAYRRQLAVSTMWGARVTSVAEDDHAHGLVAQTDVGTILSRNVVLATGPYDGPRVPSFASLLGIPALHSIEYTHPNQLPQGRVLVVGSGNTGVQIARELLPSREVFLATGRRLPELRTAYGGIELFRMLKSTGLLTLSPPRAIRARLAQREVLIGDSLDDLRREGVKIVARAVDAYGASVLFEDRTKVSFDGVLWATGFEPGYSLLPDQDRPRALQGGGKTSVRGLYLLGAPWLRSRGSALIGGVARDADRLARWIAARP